MPLEHQYVKVTRTIVIPLVGQGSLAYRDAVNKAFDRGQKFPLDWYKYIRFRPTQIELEIQEPTDDEILSQLP